MGFTRRHLLQATAASVAASFLPGTLNAAVQRVRYNAVSNEGKAMLRDYADGVRKMKSLQAGDPRSWAFQWYIHATPTDKNTLIKNTFGNANTSSKALANETWYTCQAHLNQPEDYFLPWHRIYVLQFEEIIRTLTGNNNFTLPYWDYTSPSSYSIPEEFQEKNKNNPVYSSLYVANRNKNSEDNRTADVNAGEPLNKYFTAENFLKLPDVTNANFTDFSEGLDGDLHGNIHVFTGDTTNMGRVPTAAGDPIFWLHHCNIDRIWSLWNAQSKNKVPNTTGGKLWSNTSFVFVDANGNRVEVPISTIAKESSLPYKYDILPGAASMVQVSEVLTPENKVLLKSAGAMPIMAGATQPGISLGAVTKTVQLAPITTQNRLNTIALDAASAKAPRLTLTLNKVQANIDPEITYKIYLDLPPDAQAATASEHFVGVLNFFGIAREGDHAGHGGRGGRTVSFDVTDLVKRLKSNNRLRDDTTVTLVPLGNPKKNAAPTISGGIELRQR